MHKEKQEEVVQKESRIKFIVKDIEQIILDKFPAKSNIKKDMLRQTQDILSENKIRARYKYIQRLQKLEDVDPYEINRATGNSYSKVPFQK